MISEQNKTENEQELDNLQNSAADTAKNTAGNRPKRSGVNNRNQSMRDKLRSGKGGSEKGKPGESKAGGDNPPSGSSAPKSEKPNLGADVSKAGKSAGDAAKSAVPDSNVSGAGSAAGKSSVGKSGVKLGSGAASSSVKGAQGAGQTAGKIGSSSVKAGVQGARAVSESTAKAASVTPVTTAIVIAIIIGIVLLTAFIAASKSGSSCGGGTLTGGAQEIYDFFSSKGLKDIQIAGILGNWQTESGLNPQSNQYGTWQGDDGKTYTFSAGNNSTEEYPEALVSNEYFGYGLGGFTNSGLSRSLINYAKSHGLKSGSLEAQLNWFWEDPTYGYQNWRYRDEFEACTTPEEAAHIFLCHWEAGNPGVCRNHSGRMLSKRQAFAKEFYDQMRSGSLPSGSSGATPSAITDGRATTASEMLAQTAEKQGNGLASNSCAAWVRICHEKAGLGSSWKKAVGAYQTMQLYKKAGMLHTEMNNIPRGAVVFGSGSGGPGASYGHVGIYLGNGMVIDQSRAGTSGQEIHAWCSWQTATNSGGERGWIGWVLTVGDASADSSASSGSSYDDCGDGTEIVDDVPYYNQGDPRWGSVAYWGSTISNAGCGLCSLAAGVSGLTGKEITPDQLTSSNMNGRSLVGLDYCKSRWGIKYQMINKTAEAYKQALSSGKMILITIKGTCSSGPWSFSTAGHFVLLYGYNNGQCKIMDSSGKGRAVHGQYCINVSEAAGWTQSSQPPFAFWSDSPATSSSKISGGTNPKYTGQKLSKTAGRIEGPSGQETYYNMNMSAIANSMETKKGWIWEEIKKNGNANNVQGKYHVREDGVKMFGPYVMVAANLQVRPRGSLVKTSLGTGIVVDTGGFAKNNKTQLDIAVNW